MTARLKKMWELAIEEATRLKKFATSKEIANLNFSTLDVEDSNKCVYGQMTGTCYSERALQLITKCCPRIYDCRDEYLLPSEGRLNGEPYNCDPITRRLEYHSAIEVLIFYQNGGRPAADQIVSFIKGETKKIIIPS